MIKTEKLVRIKRQHGRTIQVVREVYLRDDVPCSSTLCLSNCENKKESTLPLLPADATHYLIPDCLTVLKYLEVLELPDVTGIILLQTVLNAIQFEGGRRHYRRVQNLTKDIPKKCTVFHNEFHKYAYCTRQAGEKQEEWWARSIYQGAVWYYNHLAGQMPIVMVTIDPKVAEKYKNETLGVFVITLKEYLDKFWPSLDEAHDLYESLKVSLESSSTKDTDYSSYLSHEILEAGVKSGTYIQGTIQVSKHNAITEAFVRRKGAATKDLDNQQDVLIYGSADRNRSVHGDSVVVELLPRSQWQAKSDCIHEKSESSGGETDKSEHGNVSGSSKNVIPTGRVVGVLQRNWKDYVVSISQEETTGMQKKAGKILVIPWDWRIPKIRISTRQIETLKNQRVIVRIDNWETGSQYPNGHFVKSLGQAGLLETEIAALLIENEISVRSFTDALLKEMPVNTPDQPWKMDPEEMKKRKDMRHSHLVFSIDPKGCEDVDDTLSVRKLDNGNLELGVHIADVTYFVKPQMLADFEARSRSTTVYLADRRYDMLPAVLSADLCSLISGVDRFAMSVIWEMNENFQVVNVWYGRTLIRSKYKLYYEIAQEMHDGASDDTIIESVQELQEIHNKSEQMKAIKELKWSVDMLMEIARQLKGRRTQHGALELEGAEVKVEMSSDSSDKSIQNLIPKKSLEIHETIAECMIFANHWVAKKICQAYPSQALLRHHPLPREEYFANLVRCAKAKGFNVNTNTNKDLAKSLDSCEDPNDPIVNKILRTLATQAMSNAAYFSTGSLGRNQFFHYGLALEFYTHFTSPIRRYADIVVHRLLLAALGVDNESMLFKNTELQELCEHINTKHRASQNAQRDSQELFQTLFFKDKSPDDESCIVDAVVFQLRSNGILVHIPRYGIKGSVYLKNKEGQVIYIPKESPAEWVGGTLSQDDFSITVNSTHGTQTYRLFDHVTVNIKVQEMHAHASSLKLTLLSNRGLTSTSSCHDTAKQQKGAIIKEVQELEDERIHNQETVNLGENFSQWKEMYGQTSKEKSFYCLLQSFYDMAMMDI